MNNYFSINRLYHLVLNDLKQHATMIFITAVSLLIFFSVLPYLFVLYVGGFMLTSVAFNDLHDRQRAHLVLMLPCSNLDRFISKWFLTSIGYAMGTLALYYLFLFLTKNISEFSPGLWGSIGNYVILQSIVLLGAITFKKNALIKTALFVSIVFIFLTGLIMLNVWLFYPNYFDPIMDSISIKKYMEFWILIAPFCLYVTYLKLTEYELN